MNSQYVLFAQQEKILTPNFFGCSTGIFKNIVVHLEEICGILLIEKLNNLLSKLLHTFIELMRSFVCA